MMAQQLAGTIQRWNPVKGYGFLTTDDGAGGDIFFHASQFISPVPPTAGMRVQFELVPGRDGGMRAVKVKHTG